MNNNIKMIINMMMIEKNLIIIINIKYLIVLKILTLMQQMNSFKKFWVAFFYFQKKLI